MVALEITAHDGRVTLHAESAPLQRVLELLADQTGLLVTGDLTGAPVSARFVDLSLEAALDKILQGRSYFLEMSSEPLTLRVLSTGRISPSELTMAMEDPSVLNRVTALARVDRSNGANPTGLETALNDANPEVRISAVDAMESLNGATDESLALLERALTDASPEVRFAAVGLLSDLGGARSIPALRSALTDPDLTIREEAVFALASFDSQEANAALQYALDDPDAGIREITTILLAAPGRNPTE